MKEIIEYFQTHGSDYLILLREHVSVSALSVLMAMPSIIAGIRLAIISTTGIATIAATINAGGLGKILLSGLRTLNVYKISWGMILSVIIALIADLGLKQLERMSERKKRGFYVSERKGACDSSF